jgi:hypothetical protein
MPAYHRLDLNCGDLTERDVMNTNASEESDFENVLGETNGHQ